MRVLTAGRRREKRVMLRKEYKGRKEGTGGRKEGRKKNS
jgi:hypothetical protein